MKRSLTSSLAQVRAGAAKSNGTDCPGVDIEKLQKSLGTDPNVALGCWEAFKKYDVDGSNMLDSAEAELLMKQLLGPDLSSEYVQDKFKLVDKDRSNSVSFEEFLKMFLDTVAELNIHSEVLLFRMNIIQKPQRIEVPKIHVVKMLKNEIDEEQSCKSLPSTVMLLIVFLVSLALREQSFVIHMLEKSVHFDLNENANFAFGGAVPFDNGRMGHKSLYDVNTFADFYSWLSMGLTPLLFHDTWDQSEVRTTIRTLECFSKEQNLNDWGASFYNNSWGSSNDLNRRLESSCPEAEPIVMTESEAGMYLYFNRIIGGMRLRQYKAAPVDCWGTERLAVAYGQPCFPSVYYLEPEHPESLEPDQEKVANSLTEWFLLPSPLKDVRIRLKELEDEAWLQQGTERVEVAFPSFNANEGLLTMTYMHIFVTRGGHFWKQVVQASVWLEMYHAGPVQYLADVIWFLMTLQIFFSEGMDVVNHWRYLGFKKGSLAYFNPWNAVDWISVISGIGLAVGLYIQYIKVADVKESLEEYDYKLEGGFGNKARLLEFVEESENVVRYARQVRICFAFYPFVIGARLFKAFSAQPRLALVTRTLSNACVDIVHFGLVFLSILCIFAASGMALFGRELQEFSTYGRSLSSALRFILGDYDFIELQEVGRTEAGIWIWSFNILIVNIMLNMLIAIVMDSYVEVKAELANTETLWSQTIESYNRWKGSRAGTFISLDKVLEKLDHTPVGGELSDPYHKVTCKELTDLVEGLSAAEASEILESAKKSVKVEEDGNAALSRLESRTQQIIVGVEKLLGQRPEALKKVERVDDTGNGNDNDNDHGRSSCQRRVDLAELSERLEGRMDHLDDRVTKIEGKIDLVLDRLSALCENTNPQRREPRRELTSTNLNL